MRTPKFLATHPVFSEPVRGAVLAPRHASLVSQKQSLTTSCHGGWLQGDFMALINPVMKARSDQLVLGPEGCLR